MSRVLQAHQYDISKYVECKKLSDTFKKSLSDVTPVMVSCSSNFKSYSLEKLWKELPNLKHEPLDAYIIGYFNSCDGIYEIHVDFG